MLQYAEGISRGAPELPGNKESQQDQNGGTNQSSQSNVIDNFERKSIKHYNNPSNKNWKISSNHATNGSRNLFTDDTGYYELISLPGDGLNKYPQAGDTFEGTLGVSGDNASVLFGVEPKLEDPPVEPGGRAARGYQANISPYGGSIKIEYLDIEGGEAVGETLTKQPARISRGQTYRLAIDWGSDGSVTLTVRTSDGDRIGQVQTNDSRRTKGGFGFRLGDFRAPVQGWADNWRITSSAENAATGNTTGEPQDSEGTGVVSSFFDDFSDGNINKDPIWFSTTGDANTANTDVNINVVELTEPIDTRALEFDINWGKAQVTTGKKLRFDAPWTLDTKLRFPKKVQPCVYNIRFGRGSGGLFGSEPSVIYLNVKEQGSNANRRASIGVSGKLINDAQSIDKILRADTWYRLRVRHQGDGTYRVGWWPASDSQDNAATAVARGKVPETAPGNELPLRVTGRRIKGATRIQTAYINYRTDAASRNK